MSDLEDILISDSNVGNYIVNKVYVENLLTIMIFQKMKEITFIWEIIIIEMRDLFLSRRLKNKMLRVGDRGKCGEYSFGWSF